MADKICAYSSWKPTPPFWGRKRSGPFKAFFVWRRLLRLGTLKDWSERVKAQYKRRELRRIGANFYVPSLLHLSILHKVNQDHLLQPYNEAVCTIDSTTNIIALDRLSKVLVFPWLLADCQLKVASFVKTVCLFSPHNGKTSRNIDMNHKTTRNKRMQLYNNLIGLFISDVLATTPSITCRTRAPPTTRCLWNPSTIRRVDTPMFPLISLVEHSWSIPVRPWKELNNPFRCNHLWRMWPRCIKREAFRENSKHFRNGNKCDEKLGRMSTEA